MRPLVSVVIPNYNHAKFLPKRIESVLNQTYNLIEVLILDDASSDNSIEIIRKYKQKDKRIQVYLNEINSGSTFLQWEKGISLAKGEYVWLAESDDYADPKFLSSCIQMVMSNKDVGLIFCQSWRVDENDSIQGSYLEWTNDLDKERWKLPYVNEGSDEIKNYFCFKNIIPNASAAVFKKSLVLNMDEEKSYRLVGDKVFWAKILLKTVVGYIPEHYNYFRFHSQSVRNTNKEERTFEENVNWYRFLFKEIEIPKDNRKIIQNKLYMWWASLIQKNNFSKRDIVVLKGMQEIDSIVSVRILFYLLKNKLYKIIKVRLSKVSFQKLFS
jgi:glycosyltransferase involved in cell wall biosynthesis